MAQRQYRNKKILNENGDITTEMKEIKKKKKQILLQRPILNKTRKSGRNGQFSRQVPGTKVKSRSDKSPKQANILQKK
jgi:hypothetical protein